MEQDTGHSQVRRYNSPATTTDPLSEQTSTTAEAGADGPPGDGPLGGGAGDNGAEGGGAGGGSELPWRPGQVRRGPALLIVGIVLVISVGGFTLAALGGHSPRTALPTGGKVGTTGLSTAAATPLFTPISSGGDPPSDVLGALTVPAGSTESSHERNDAELELYDGTVTLSVAAKQQTVLAFYRDELKAGKWKVTGPDATADGKGTELFGTRPAADGFYWEVVVEIRPANPSITPALNGDDSSDQTSLALRLFEQNDAD